MSRLGGNGITDKENVKYWLREAVWIVGETMVWAIKIAWTISFAFIKAACWFSRTFYDDGRTGKK